MSTPGGGVYTGPDRRKAVDYASQVNALRFVVWVLGAVVLVLVGLTASMSSNLMHRVATVEQLMETHMSDSGGAQCEGG